MDVGHRQGDDRGGSAPLTGNSYYYHTSKLSEPSLVGVHEGKLILGTWQAIFFAEFDGPRHRRVAVKLITG